MAVKKPSKSSLKIKEAMPVLTDKTSIIDKIKKPKFFFPLVIVVVLAVGAFFLKGLFIAALINGQPITRLSVIQELERQGGKQALTALVNQTLILQEAKKKNVDVDQKEVETEAKQIEESLKKQGQNLDTALAMQGLTRQDFLMQVKLRSLVEKLLADQIKVTDKEISDYMEKNKETIPADLKEDEVKKGIREQLEQQKLATKSQEWIDGLNKNAKINYFVNY